jgi:hypothetical protein
MGIALDEISLLEEILNKKLSSERLSFKMSVHFQDRANDLRNNPRITITELQGIFDRLTTAHLNKLIKFNDLDTFNVRCTRTDINIPCAVNVISDGLGYGHRKIIAITVMRKRDFRSKDSDEIRLL